MKENFFLPSSSAPFLISSRGAIFSSVGQFTNCRCNRRISLPIFIWRSAYHSEGPSRDTFRPLSSIRYSYKLRIPESETQVPQWSEESIPGTESGIE